jgi:undecaprenyl-diphosphatase
MNYAYQSFPSGHTSASVAAGTSLLITAPPVGAVAFVSAVSMGWASTFTRAHYLSDVTAGLGAGLWFGLALGWAARRMNQRDARHLFRAGPV